jgi:hypothetical protein
MDNHPDIIYLQKELHKAKKSAGKRRHKDIGGHRKAGEPRVDHGRRDDLRTEAKEPDASTYGLDDESCNAGARMGNDVARGVRSEGSYLPGAYHVSPSGKDNNTGSQDSPFLTIAQCAAVMKAGDTCVVHQGTYRETVVLPRSGANGRPIRFLAAQDEGVVIDGTEPVTGPWTLHQGSVYKTKVDRLTSQVFVDGEMAIEARWPNISFAERWRQSSWAKTGKGSRYGKIVDANLASTQINWTGAIATLNVAHQFYSWTRRVKKHAKGSDVLVYEKNLPGITRYATATSPWEDDRYFVTGKLEALDSPGEWYLDRASKMLYLWSPDGKSPELHSVDIKVRDYGFTARNKHHIELRGFQFFGTTLANEGGDHWLVDGVHLRYPTFTRELTESEVPSRPVPTTLIKGSDNVFRNSSLSYASTGLEVIGSRNKVVSNRIWDIAWHGSLRYPALKVSGSNAETFNVIRHNSIHDSGTVLLHFSGQPHIVEYNHIFRGGRASKDVCLLQTHSPRVAGSIIRYNWVHDSTDICIRGDDQTRGLIVHHNVAWGCRRLGLVVKGDENKVFSNTILGKLLIPTRAEPKKPWRRRQWPLLPVQNANSEYFNNAAASLGWRGKRLPASSRISNNVTRKNLGILLVDVKRRQFSPKSGSALVDAGRTPAGCTMGAEGKAPDVGAYELGGVNWTPGATWK